jgi:uncharacterized OsmC-like protein
MGGQPVSYLSFTSRRRPGGSRSSPSTGEKNGDADHFSRRQTGQFDLQRIYRKTDQPRSEGGEGTAPEPYDLFLSSLGTCAGVYLVYFCDARNISMEGIAMNVTVEHNQKTHMMEKSPSISVSRVIFLKISQSRRKSCRDVHGQTQSTQSAGDSGSCRVKDRHRLMLAAPGSVLAFPS